MTTRNKCKTFYFNLNTCNSTWTVLWCCLSSQIVESRCVPFWDNVRQPLYLNYLKYRKYLFFTKVNIKKSLYILTRNVVFSKSNISSASMTSAKSFKLFFNCGPLSISSCTIWDQALYNVSSHIDVWKQRKLNGRE